MTTTETQFTGDELALIAEALDSHLYWQLSSPERRRDGYVMEPLTEAERNVERLLAKVQTQIGG